MSSLDRIDKNSYWIATGGGAKVQSQISRMKVAAQKGFIAEGITSTSAASFTALALVEQPGMAGIEKAEWIWHTHITSASKIYQLRPSYHLMLFNLLENRPHSPFHDHPGGLREAAADCLTQVKHLGRSVWLLFGKIPATLLYLWLNTDVSLDEPIPHAKGRGIEKLRSHSGTFDWNSVTPFLDISPLVTVLKPLIDYEKVIRSSINWNILAAREKDMHRVIFSNRDFCDINAASPEQRKEIFETVFNYTVASAALRNYFEHVWIRGEWYVDGGIVDPLPFREAFASGCKTIFVFWNPHRIARRVLVSASNNLKDAAERIALEDIYTSLYNHAKEKMYSAWREAKIRHVDFFITRPKSWHPEIDFLKISPEAMKFQDKDGTEAMEELFDNPDRYNLRLMSRDRLEEYLENEI
ncbi:MAG: hypothetical protein HYT98_04820 [Candidatus Sungbacteria bacterium]|nr:hypothetical protein [Candidatus Sungbacteria bacterium]